MPMLKKDESKSVMCEQSDGIQVVWSVQGNWGVKELEEFLVSQFGPKRGVDRPNWAVDPSAIRALKG